MQSKRQNFCSDARCFKAFVDFIGKEGLNMLDLGNVPAGQDCEILWMFGPYSETLKKRFRLAESKIMHVVSNLGTGYVIVTVDGKKMAISSDVSSMLKVQPC